MGVYGTIERMQIRASEEEIQGFFTRLDRETEYFPGFHIAFGHHDLLLRFPDEETKERYRAFLALICTERGGEPDGTITLLHGEIGDYLNISGGSGSDSCWEYKGEDSFIRYVGWQGRMLAYHTPGCRQYTVMSGPFDGYNPYCGPFHWEFHNFSASHGYALVHSGAVGLNGEGVLISSLGGCGKSTTVLSCLLDGLDYVADDYLILERETAKAYPLYNSGVLNEDSLQRLPELKPFIADTVPGRKGRYIIDLSRYRDQFCHGMNIKAIVHPRVLPGGGPEGGAIIRKDPNHTAKTQLLVSSARQNGFVMMRDQDALHYLFGAVSGLPSYELILSQDRQSNCRALRDLLGVLSETKQGEEK